MFHVGAKAAEIRFDRYGVIRMGADHPRQRQETQRGLQSDAFDRLPFGREALRGFGVFVPFGGFAPLFPFSGVSPSCT